MRNQIWTALAVALRAASATAAPHYRSIGSAPDYSVGTVIVHNGETLVVGGSAERPVANGAPRPRRSGHDCFALPHAVVEGRDLRRKHGRPGRDFDVYETSALELDVYCLGPTPEELRARVDLPNGEVYETLDAERTDADAPAPPGKGPSARTRGNGAAPGRGTFITQ